MSLTFANDRDTIRNLLLEHIAAAVDTPPPAHVSSLPQRENATINGDLQGSPGGATEAGLGSCCRSEGRPTC